MKISEMPYTRPNLEEIRKNSEAILQRLASAACCWASLADFSAPFHAASSGASRDMEAGWGYSREPHTGQGVPGQRSLASIPAWASR